MREYGVCLQEVLAARRRIRDAAHRTPLAPSVDLGRIAGAPVHLKLECVQRTGSFKVRGAANRLLSLSDEERRRGVLAFSTGNHGRAVAWVAGQLGVRAVICLSTRVPLYRVAAMEELGARVVRHGASQDEAYARALELEREEGLTLIPPFDDPHVIAGQGTLALEILEDRPQVDTVLVPVSGGGLAAGVALVMKAASPKIRVVGVSLEVSSPMHASLAAGEPVEIEERDSLADALLGGIGLDNRYTFAMVRDLVDEVILVSEAEIAAGVAHALGRERLVVEGSGAVGIAALLHGRVRDLGDDIAVVVSGGNIAARQLLELARERIA